MDFADTGHGISEENLEKIFDPFFTTKETGHGVGLGLAISYGIIKEHQGTISVESQVGQGTTFSIRLPLAAERSREWTIRSSSLTTKKSSWIPALRFWRTAGIPLRSATTGAQGLALLPEYQPDLVFVDLKMPGLSGFEVLERIRALDPTIVTIVITGFATVSSAVDAMKQGAYDFLPKPFTPDEFRLIVQRGFEKRRLVLETMALRREKEMLREQFAAIISHEVRSPLGAIQQSLMALQMEMADKLDEDQTKRLERLKVRMDDLLKLIHTWLRVMSVDVNKLRETFKPVSVPEVVTKAIESVQPQAVRKDIEIVTLVAPTLSPVNGDEGTLVETLVNLLNNAVKYSPVSSQVTVKAEEKAGEIWLAVADTGIGIPKDELPFIFEDMYVGKSGQKVEKSSGFGLAITRRIVEAHGGTVSVESELGKGSTFTIRLPALKTYMQVIACPGTISQRRHANEYTQRNC